jgi:hypothetical protein
MSGNLDRRLTQVSCLLPPVASCLRLPPAFGCLLPSLLASCLLQVWGDDFNVVYAYGAIMIATDWWQSPDESYILPIYASWK